MRYAQLVMGPAGSGKSTYCYHLNEHCETVKRNVQIVNLDPAAENFNYPVAYDVRDLVELNDVMEAEDLKLGPNGGLVFCMEYLVKSLDWLKDVIGEDEDDYFVFDCPGQIELYTHMPVMRTFVDTLQSWNFRICGVFIIDAQFLVDAAKYFSGVMSALSAMLQLEITHINIMSKMDLLDREKSDSVEKFLLPDAKSLVHELNKNLPAKYKKLNRALCGLIDDFSLVQFLPLNIKQEESIEDILVYIDNAIQYGEDLEPRDKYPEDEDDDDGPF